MAIRVSSIDENAIPGLDETCGGQADVRAASKGPPSTGPGRLRTKVMSAAVAASIAGLIAVQGGAALEMLFWVLGKLLGLPALFFAIGAAVTVPLTAYLSILLYVRCYRIERRLANGKSIEDVSWKLSATE